MRFKKHFIRILVISSMLHSSYAFSGQPVFDVSNYERAFEILKAAKEQAEQIKGVHNELTQTKAMIGRFGEDKGSLIEDLKKWQTYYDNIDSLDSDNFSALKWLGVDKLHPENYAYNTSDFVRGKFNPGKAFDDVKHQIFEDEKHPEDIKYRRQELAQNSMAASVVVSNQSKQELSHAKEKIHKIMPNAIGASDLLTAMREQNKLLVIMAEEMVQQRKLQAQQLELLASFFARFEGTSKMVEPSKRKPFKTKWD